MTGVYKWIPNVGALTVSFSPQAVGSLYLSKLDIPVAFSATPVPPNGNPFYTATPIDDNPQTIPMPAGTQSVSLSASSSGTYYVFAQSDIFRLNMTGAASA